MAPGGKEGEPFLDSPFHLASGTTEEGPVAPIEAELAPMQPDEVEHRTDRLVACQAQTTSELLQAHLPESRVVKAFNHIYAAQLTTDGQAAGSKDRRALVIAGDDLDAKATVRKLLDQFGFDTVDAGPLKEGWRIQRDTPGYGPRRTAEELRRDLAAARRYVSLP